MGEAGNVAVFSAFIEVVVELEAAAKSVDLIAYSLVIGNYVNGSGLWVGKWAIEVIGRRSPS